MEWESRRLKRELDTAAKQRDKRLCHYAYLSFVFANIFALVRGSFKNMAKWLPVDPQNTKMITIGADKAERGCGFIGKTPYVIVGDALATVDPTTGKGASTAIAATKYFQHVLEDVRLDPSVSSFQSIDVERNLQQTLKGLRVGPSIHSSLYSIDVERNLQQSKQMRRLYRPDAV